MKKTNIHAIVMPNKSCNLACTYCYVLEKPNERMSVELAERVVDELLAYNDPDQPTRFIWHGGEPMLAGLGFYTHICAYILDHYPDYLIEHYIQTNGTLLYDEWIDFFIEHDFNVGVSLDGWKTLHDQHRKTRDGKGTFELIFRNISRAREKGLICGILSVITRQSLGHEEELFEFFGKHRLDFGFHPVTSLTLETEQQLSLTPEQFADVSIKFFDMGFINQAEPRFTSATPTFHYAMAVMMGYPSGFCVLAETCAAEYISIEPTGRVHVCDRFAGNEALSFGNIAQTSLENILKSPIRKQFLYRWQEIKKLCGDCEWASVCYGGCPHEAYARNGSIFSRDPNCAAYKQIFAYVSTAISNELEKATLSKSE